MSKLLFAVLLSALFVMSGLAQTAPTSPVAESATEAPKRGPVFRATKSQIKDVQSMLKDKKLYTGEMTGKLDDATRTSIKSYQKDNGLRVTGTLNRATLEKMNIELTDGQKAMPVSSKSYAAAGESTPAASGKTDASSKRVIFRASKDQVIEAQKILKEKNMYGGSGTGKLDDETRDALKKYQAANGLKPTGTLNQATLEKMGIELTEKQRSTTSK